MAQPRTLFDKIWDSHVITPQGEGTYLIYIDLHLIHEVTTPQAFEGLRLAGRKVRRPDATMAVCDHNIPTSNRKAGIDEPESKLQVDTLEQNVRDFGVPYFPIDSINQGIVHIIGPEQGLSQQGMTIVCGDSHTATHGALGALAFGIGTSEVGHVLEYRGSAIRSLSMEGRMTVCNMSIEAGARAGLVAPDDTTFAYLEGRPYAPKGAAWERALDDWRSLVTDADASFDKDVLLDASTLAPQVTWGTSPGLVTAITGRVPDPAAFASEAERRAAERALEYMDLKPGTPLAGLPIDRVFLGSCT